MCAHGFLASQLRLGLKKTYAKNITIVCPTFLVSASTLNDVDPQWTRLISSVSKQIKQTFSGHPMFFLVSKPINDGFLSGQTRFESWISSNFKQCLVFGSPGWPMIPPNVIYVIYLDVTLQNSPTGKINTCGVPYSKHHFRWRKHVRSWSHLARYNYVLYIKIWLVFHGFGAGHLRGSRLLLFFAFYYENNIVWVGGGVGWDNNVICTSTHMWCNIFVRSLAFHSHPHIRHATLL